MFDKKIFGQRIKELRIKNQLTQTQLAEVIGVHKSVISEIENGINTTTLEKVYILADYFNVSIDYLTGRTNKK
jgi:transcriptional regulator with XRE-family HTH domain